MVTHYDPAWPSNVLLITMSHLHDDIEVHRNLIDKQSYRDVNLLIVQLNSVPALY